MELFTPEFGLVFWMFLVFVILFVILAKYAWPAIMKSVDERADFIDKGVSYAQEAKSQLEHATENAQALITEAQQKQLEIMREAAQMKSQIIEEARKAATVEAKNYRCSQCIDRIGSKGIRTAIPAASQRFCFAGSREIDAKRVGRR